MKTCEQCGIDETKTRIINYKGKLLLCNRHRLQLSKNGVFSLTRNDPHTVIKEDKNIVIFKVESKWSNKNPRYVTISKSDKNKVFKKHWIHYGLYIATGSNKDRTFLHHYIIGRKKGLVVDHIDNDKDNNTRKNLRFATYSENNVNRKEISGVAFDKKNNKWCSSIEKGGKKYWLGRFKTKEEAILARIDKQKELYGRITKAHTNFLKERDVKRPIL